MTLKEFISDRERRTRLAELVGCSEGYLQQLAGGYRGKRPSVELAKRVEAASREIGPETVSAVELVFAEPVVSRRRYVRRAQQAGASSRSEDSVSRALMKICCAVKEAVAELEGAKVVAGKAAVAVAAEGEVQK